MTNRSSIVRGDVGMVSGTWLAIDSATGTVDTGGSVILAHGLTVGSAGVVSGTAQIVFSNKNKRGNLTTKNGTIAVTSIDTKDVVAGDWWAVVRV